MAASLARAGVASEVFERADALTAEGAGIQLAPNATRLLRRLGLAARLDAVAVRPSGIEMRRWTSGATIATTELGAACEARYGAPYYTLHRADLQRVLFDAVAASPEVSLRLGRRCVGVSEAPGAATVHFADGATAEAGLVIGADGIHSVVRGALEPDLPRYGGMDVYRGLIPIECLPHLSGEPAVRIWLGPGRHCVCYPVAGGALMSFVASGPGDGAPIEDPDSWSTPGVVSDLVAAYQGWHSDVLELLGNAGAVTRWALHDRAPLPRLHAGRVVVAGDAAHAMLPFGAQGANQAIEAAATLAACLRGATSATLGPALDRYERIRLPRLARVGAAVRGNAGDHHLVDGPAQRRRDRHLTAHRSLSRQGWLYGYDAERVAAASGTRSDDGP
jgi:salicylate hydroxylase